MEEITKKEFAGELTALQEQESELLLWARNEVECKLRIGKALKTIRDASLYKEAGFKSFGEYLDNRAFESLKIGQTQGYKYVKAYEVYGNRLHVPNTTNLDEKLIEFKFYFQETQANLKKFLDVINKVDDPEKKAKFKGAAKKFVTAILEELDKVEG